MLQHKRKKSAYGIVHTSWKTDTETAGVLGQCAEESKWTKWTNTDKQEAGRNTTSGSKILLNLLNQGGGNGRST